MIRPARYSDIETLLDLGEQMHAESPRFSRYTYSRDRVRETLVRLVQSDQGCVLIAEKNDEIVGGIVGMVTPQWFSDELVGNDLALFISPTKRGGIVAARLVRGFVEWAKLSGAKVVQLGITTGVQIEQTAQLYLELGLTECGILFEV